LSGFIGAARGGHGLRYGRLPERRQISEHRLRTWLAGEGQ